MGKRGAPENMRPPRTKAEAKARGAKGGKASGVARREKKLMSQIYAEFLAEKFNVKTEHGPRFTTGEKLVNQVVKQVLIAGGPGAVSLMREIREATELVAQWLIGQSTDNPLGAQTISVQTYSVTFGEDNQTRKRFMELLAPYSHTMPVFL